MESEKVTLIDKQGSQRVEWSDSSSYYDLILTTLTKPRKAKGDLSVFGSKPQLDYQH